VLALLGIGGAERMDGRVLTEALIGSQAPGHSAQPDRIEAAVPGYGQRLHRTRYDDHIYIDEAYRFSV
jgi:hypothetical protein